MLSTKTHNRRVRFENLESRKLLATLADIDLDGDLDIVDRGAWHENHDSYGNFTRRDLSFSSDSIPADLDGDGDVDLATAVGWYANTDGSGTFSDLRSFDVPPDFAADEYKLIDAGFGGHMDVMARQGDRAILFRNDGAGQFSKADEIEIAGLVDATDIDMDGDLDGLVHERLPETRVVVHVNNGDRFAKNVWHRDVPINELNDIRARTTSSRFADFDNDGSIDVLSDQIFDDQMSIALLQINNGRAAPGDTRTYSCIDFCRFLIDDFEQDGTVDLVGDSTLGSLHVYSSGGQRWRHDWFASYKDGGDINGDGFIDILSDRTEWYDGETGLRHIPGEATPLESGRFVFVRSQHPLPDRDELIGPVEKLVVGHFDSDNLFDSLYSNATGIAIQFGDGETRELVGGRSNLANVQIVDMDGDGDSDVAGTHGRTLFWIENLGDGRFNESFTFATSGRMEDIRDIEFADFNQDGLMDVVAGKTTTFRVFLNQGRGQRFETIPVNWDGVTVNWMATSDMDLDGDQDIFVAGQWDSEDGLRNYTHRWIKNDGAEFFSQVTSIRPLDREREYTLGDINNDGTQDLIVNSSFQAGWYESIVGTFHSLPNGTRYEVMDIDQDGRNDIAYVESNGRAVWRPGIDDAGGFGDANLLNTSSVFQSLDHDLDGDIDFLSFLSPGILTISERYLTGDSNKDGIVNSRDLVQVFREGQFEDSIQRNSTFETGDWNGDGDFTTADLVLLFQTGNYSSAVAIAPVANRIAAAIAADHFFDLFHEKNEQSRKNATP